MGTSRDTESAWETQLPTQSPGPPLLSLRYLGGDPETEIWFPERLTGSMKVDDRIAEGT